LTAIGAGVIVLVGIGWLGWRSMQRPPAEQAVGTTAAAPERSDTSSAPSPPPITGDSAAKGALEKLDLPTLLARGDEYLAYGQKNYGEKLDFPAGENAIDMYQEALRRDPGNARAAKGLEQIAGFFEQAATGALRNGLYTATDEFIGKGLRADPKNAALLKLKADLAKAEQNG
jgi:hypothetical protein